MKDEDRLVSFTPDAVKDYLDMCIDKWRGIRDNPADLHRRLAPGYIDAFQSVRVSLFGELKD